MKVSELCLGAMTFGEETGFGAPETECRRVFDAFLAAGGNFIDTANIYQRGSSERMLAGFIASQRDALVIASKYSMSGNPADPNSGGNHRLNLVRSLEHSLRRLNTDYLDLFWIHGWDRSTPLSEVMRALDDQVRAGKILHIGISNAPAWVVSAANVLARERGLTPFTALQLHYNLAERSIERDFFDLAEAQDMAITPWSPLAGGLLTGKYESATGTATSGRLYRSPTGAKALQDKNLAVAAALRGMAAEIGCKPSQLALAWLCQRTAVPVIPIIGARTLPQLIENLGCIELTLSPAHILKLDQLTALQPEYPGTLLSSEFFGRMMFGDALERIERRPFRL